MRIAIVGSKGIPAAYGGFETLAEYLAINLVAAGNEVTVYCSGKGPKKHKGVKLKYLTLRANGLQGIAYDFFSLIHANRRADVILMLGSPAGFLLRFIPDLRYKLVFNYGGLDFNRAKWNRLVQRVIKLGKDQAVKKSWKIVADNQKIFDYVRRENNIEKSKIALIPYGGDHALKIIKDPGILLPKEYFLTIARIQEDNNIELILDAGIISGANIVVVGNWSVSRWSKKVFKKYSKFDNLFLLNPIYNTSHLAFLRSNCSGYIHGHSAGGSNPTLIEIMFFRKPLYCFNNGFNNYTTNGLATYWDDKNQLVEILLSDESRSVDPNLHQYAMTHYSWKDIVEKYIKVFYEKSI